MQRRLLISMLSVAIAAVLALGIPLAFVLGRLQVDEANQILLRDAQEVARNLQLRYGAGQPIGPVGAAQAARTAEQAGPGPLSDRYVQIWQGPRLLARVGTRPPGMTTAPRRSQSRSAPWASSSRSVSRSTTRT